MQDVLLFRYRIEYKRTGCIAKAKLEMGKKQLKRDKKLQYHKTYKAGNKSSRKRRQKNTGK